MRYKLVALGLVLLVYPTELVTQEVAPPTAGTWAAEGNLGSGGTFLRFSDTRRAWLLGLGIIGEVRDVESTTGSAGTSGFVDVFMKIGRRKYRRPEQPIRPFTSVGIIGQHAWLSRNARRLSAGVFGELGASYFVSRNLSFGAVSELRVTYDRSSYPDTDYRVNSVRGLIQTPRAIVTVYF